MAQIFMNDRKGRGGAYALPFLFVGEEAREKSVFSALKCKRGLTPLVW
jgi:hypothetical protein